MPAPRGPSSRITLQIDWEHATCSGSAAPAGDRTTAVQQRRALGADEALATIVGQDRRPVLVLRECLQCAGTEDALMSDNENNERTYLLSRWFHCIKLSPDVLEDDHPFRNLFPGDKPSHLFIANADGSARHDLEGEHSRRELWDAMEGAIEANYEGGHEAALSSLGKILDELDEVDRAISDYETRYELAVATDGARAAKTKKIQKELNERRGRRADLLAEAVKASALVPKTLVPTR